MTSKVEIAKATLYKINDYTICLIYKSDVNFELEDAIEVNNIIYEMSGGKSYVVLVDGRGVYGNITNDARNHYVTDPKTKHIRLAEALLIDNLPARIFARFYIKVNSPFNPVKIFAKENEALKWLDYIYSINSIPKLTK